MEALKTVSMSDYKRDYPRIKKSLPAELIASGNKKLHASTFDVSRTGVQIICDGITAEEIFGASRQAGPSRHPRLKIALRLLHPETGPARVEADCRAVFSRRVSEQEYRIGLHIDQMSEEARLILDGFVDDCLNPT